MAVKMGVGVGMFSSGDFDLSKARHLVQRVLDSINNGIINYNLFITRKD